MKDLLEISSGSEKIFERDITAICTLNSDQFKALVGLIDSGKKILSFVEKDELDTLAETIRENLGVSREYAISIVRVIMNISVNAYREDYGILSDAKKVAPKLDPSNLVDFLSLIRESEISKPLKRALERESISSSMLPNVSEFSVITDVRCVYTEDSIEHAVPVIVINLVLESQTDEEAFTFQLTPNLAKRISEALTDEVRKTNILKQGIPKSAME